MSQDYLLKTEPSEYSFADLQSDGTTVWDGISKPCRGEKSPRDERWRKTDRPMKLERAKSAVGTATVVSVDASDPKNPKGQDQGGKPIAKPVPLAEIKANKMFKDSARASRKAVRCAAHERTVQSVGGA